MNIKQFITALAGSLMGAIALLPGTSFAQQVPTTLRQGMPYGEARQILIDAGWQAAIQSPMGRPQYAPLNYIIGDLGYHEVVDCSGTGMGFCWFEFVDAYGRTIKVTTTNNQPDWGGPILHRWVLEEGQ
jgi:hypothetical protein